MGKPASKRTKQSSFKTATPEIPSPFSPAPTSLALLLERFDPTHVHIVHIDRTPPEQKKSTFLIPVALNGTIALLLAWRLYHAVPSYWVLLQTFLGYTTSATVNTTATTRGQQIAILLKRTLMIFADFLLFRFIGVWPLTFFAEQPANPCLWRWQLGFRREEVVVRVSRHWGTEELLEGSKRGDQSPFFMTRISPAVEPSFMRKTGYLMMDKNWDLDFELMLDAEALLKQQQIKMDELENRVFAHLSGAGWLSWRPESDEGTEPQGMTKLVRFKEKLTAMGKESLFWKWTDIVEQESEADGSVTPEKQTEVLRRVRDEFEKNQIDFDAVVDEIGGLPHVQT